jgi:hypothetical protein
MYLLVAGNVGSDKLCEALHQRSDRRRNAGVDILTVQLV